MMRRTGVRVALALLAAGALAGLLGFAWLVVMYPNRPVETRASRTVAVVLDAQSTLHSVARELARDGLVAQPDVFALYARVLGARERLRVGRILVTSQMSARQLLQRLATGYGSTPLLITIPEGWNRFDVADRIADWGICTREEFLRAVQAAEPVRTLDERADSSEGYLFPDTYWLRDQMTPAQLVERFTDNARKRLATLLQSEAPAFAQLHDEFGFGLHEVVVLASIVEKEAHAPSEQPLIAGVFLNRLRSPDFHPKRLQADPTVAYGCLLMNTLASCAGFDGKHVTRVMTADPQNLYNTYRFEGLPRAPIANPGISALRAVLRPAKHDYFYFVARGDGQHSFSANLQAHILAVQKQPIEP
jgi:UPF0755 protein